MPKEVIVISRFDFVEVWGTLTKCCEVHKEFQYPTIKKLKFPFEHKGFTFRKVKYRSKK